MWSTAVTFGGGIDDDVGLAAGGRTVSSAAGVRLAVRRSSPGSTQRR